MKHTTRAKIGKAVTEALEDRALYSSVSLQDGVLSLALDAPGRVIVDYVGPGKLWAYAGDKQMRVNSADVKSIKVTGSAGNDNIFINPYLTVPTDMDLGDGNDTVRGSGGADVIRAGRGNDVIFARGGDDRVDAGGGNDIVWGGEGNDTLYGGAGSDKAYGNEGVNTVDLGSSANIPPSRPVENHSGNGGDTNLPPATPVDTGTNPRPTPAPIPTPVEETPSSSVDAPVVKVEFVKKSVAAGQAVHAHALNTELKNGTILTAKFEWTFGDDSNTTLVGWNVGHTYAKAGTYTMTLTVTDALGNRTVKNETITITEANRTKIYVSATGNDNNDGLTPETAIRSVAKASSKIDDNTEVLFRRGDKFNVTEAMAIADTNVVIGAYGTGSRPVLMRQAGGSGRGIISIWISSVDITVRDITFDSPYTFEAGYKGKIEADAIYAGGKDITVSGCEFLNLTDAINSDRDVKGLLVENNIAPLTTGIRGYLVWGEGTDHVYLNNTVANSTREHAIRVNFTNRILVAVNDFANRDRTATGDKEDIAKGAIELHTVSHGYVTGNTVRDGALRAGPRGAAEATTTKAEWIVFEGNTVLNVGMTIRPGTHHVMIRNNVINNEAGESIVIYKPDAEGRVSSDITVDNNTAVNHASSGKFIMIQGKVNGITLTDNLYVAPNLKPTDNAAAPVYVAMNDLSVFTRISGNVWPSVTGGNWAKGGINYVGDTWGSTSAYKTTVAWEDYDVVEGDQFTNVDPSSMYSFKIGTSNVGSNVRLAA